MRLLPSVPFFGGRPGIFGLTFLVISAVGDGVVRAQADPIEPDVLALGFEIFNREWMPNDARAHGGDGLGPVYNDTSCVACHNLAGSGGGGPISKNIAILSASRPLGFDPQTLNAKPASSDGSSTADALLSEFHAGFRLSRTAVLHKFGLDPNYNEWRSKVTAQMSAEPDNLRDKRLAALRHLQKESRVKGADPDDSPAAGQIREIVASVVANNPGMTGSSGSVGPFLVSRSERNPTALFGLGVIEAIPDAAIEATARHQSMKSPATAGRVSRLAEGRIGRLGWKGQTANIEDFVSNACAIEIGLEVPGHHQAILPQAPRYQSSGLDLTADECGALTAYVRHLPRPVERPAAGAHEAKELAAGRAAFAGVGCAGCHTPRLGDVDGIYSDLLLHDLGTELANDGSYSDGFRNDVNRPIGPDRSPDLADTKSASPSPATAGEWRTPPLWGFRDSGPYLHDGRAQTLDQAVAMHGGQAGPAALKYFELTPRERLQVETFLKSLIAPRSIELADDAR